MIVGHPLTTAWRRSGWAWLNRSFSVLALLMTTVSPLTGSVASVAAAPLEAPTTVLEISVVDATDASAIPEYQFLINEDNTGDPAQPRTPDCDPTVEPSLADCDWPSIRAVPGAAPIVTQGDQTILDDTLGLNLQPYLAANPGATKFLISVVADGYKIGGTHFTIDSLDTDTPVVVELVPNPLPLATMRIQVFDDSQSPNGQMDAPVELGLNGFEGRISDVLGEISTDWYGNPLCTEYDTNGDPVPGTGGVCLSGDTNHDGVVDGADDPADRGMIVIPNIGSGRYAALVVPPNGTDWVQTTTLEGGHDWDTWLQEGATGFDTEFIFAGEPFPWTMFGFTRPRNNFTAPTPNEIRGTVVGISVYIPPQGGTPIPGGEWGGLAGAKIKGPIDRPYIALSDLNADDAMVYMQRGNADGTFTINNVPNGTYLLTAWDGPQTHLIDFYNVTVNNGDVDMGNVFLTGWFADFSGSVFIDTDADGVRDPGEKGLAGQEITIRSRGNNLVQHGAAILTTDANGYYHMENGYPFTAWEIMEVYNDRYHTTGITYQADNGPETTVLGAGVDVNILPIIGLSGRLDWGVLPYARGENGGIVGTVTYDVTRNELDPRLAAAEDWQPSIPDMTVNLYQAVRNPNGTFAKAPDGSYQKGALINSTVTETWERPSDCEALDVDGLPVVQQALPVANSGGGCVEAPMTGIQFGPLSDGTNFGASVNGNYGFGDGCFGPGGFDVNTQTCANGADPTVLPAGDYLVEVVSPNDLITGNPLYKVTREEDINVFNGDEYTTLLPPPPCAGALHTVDVLAAGNQKFWDEGGSPFEGQARPLCDVKLVRLQDSRSIAPTFNFFTDVPLPGRFLGYIVDDLNLSTDPRTTLFGEKAGLANVPVGVYDFADRLVTTLQSDPNGLWEVLLPSTLQINCPTPSGVCSNMYRFVGNDPGQPPDRLNPNHNPQYRTITANFEVWPGVINPADLAPTQIAVSIQGPGSQFNAVSQCALDAATPKFFAVSRPFVRSTDSGPARNITIYGDDFGALGPNSQVTLNTTTPTVLPIVSWTDEQIVVTIPPSSAANRGARQLMVRADNGQSTVNGLTFHVLTGNGNSAGGGSGTVTGTAYNPRILTVNAPPAAFTGITNFTTIQAALTAAADNNGAQRYLVVVFPGPTALYNPTGIYFENVVMYSPVKLQGVGPGGVYADGSTALGTVLDGVGFTNDNPASEDWRVLVDSIPHGGTANVAEGEVIYVLPRTNDPDTPGNESEPFNANANYPAAIDGLTIQGGDQTGFPNNINEIGGGQTGGGQPQAQGFIETQGGGIYVHSDAANLRITNNILKSNGGAYAGAIRLGTPDVGDNNNDNVRILNNRLLANGGTNLAGAIGLFTGSNGYEIAYNDLCGNFSAEYGGAISHYGDSPNGAIHHNRIYFNQSYDEGGGIMLAGSLSAPAAGTGSVSVYGNLIQSNLGNDDGGGVRVLNASSDVINIYNNFIVNNISTDEGGGVAVDTAAAVRVYNNTIMNNLTTATAATSDGTAKPAGLTAAPADNPVLFNNIFWDNRAGAWDGVTVAGIGLPASPGITLWDMGEVGGGAGPLTPTNSVLQVATGITPDPSNSIGVDPGVQAEYDTSVAVFPWRTNPNLVQAVIVALDLPVNLLGNYHLAAGSPAVNTGALSKAGVNAPATDIDNQLRGTVRDIGADELDPALLAFPATVGLDDFQRNGLPIGGNWRGYNCNPATNCTNNTGFFRLFGAVLPANRDVQVINSGFMYWNPASFGAQQEAFLTFTKVVASASDHALLLKVNNFPTGGSLPGGGARAIEVTYDPSASEVRVETLASGVWTLQATFTGVTFSAGDTFGARALEDGTVSAFQNGVPIGSANVTGGTWTPAFNSAGGRIGVWYASAGGFGGANDARFDNFGGGTLP